MGNLIALYWSAPKDKKRIIVATGSWGSSPCVLRDAVMPKKKRADRCKKVT
jgi:hypothetical protein